MAKAIPDAIADKDLDYIKANCDSMIACSGQPANYAGIAAVALADVAMVSGDFTKADHTPDGRELQVAAKNDVDVDTGGTATHIALANTSGTELLFVTTCTSLLLSSPGKVNFPAWKIINRDPT